MVSSAQNSSGPSVQYHQQSFIAHLISVAVEIVHVSVKRCLILTILYNWCHVINYLSKMCEIRKLKNVEWYQMLQGSWKYVKYLRQLLLQDLYSFEIQVGVTGETRKKD